MRVSASGQDGGRFTESAGHAVGAEPVMLRLAADGPPVAQYVWRPDLPVVLAPRPYLHPVRTIAGTPVTELMPASHRQHLGVSLAIADINGNNFWGGRTFVSGRGPSWLDNHGVQHHARWLRRSAGEVSQELVWTTYDGVPLLREERTLASRPVGTDCWVLTFAFRLTSLADATLAVRSPAVSGRAGAGYGGFFWRAPASSTNVRVFAADAAGAEALNGRLAPWLALTGVSATGQDWSLIFVATRAEHDPWFVRTRDYPGIGSSLAAKAALEIPPDGSVSRRIDTIVADGLRPRAEAEALAEAALAEAASAEAAVEPAP
jgi:Family of unknown function (DUF6807)